MAKKVNICATCRDITIDGFSESVECVKLHSSLEKAVNTTLPNGKCHDTGEVLRDAFTPCETCNSIVDTLYTFEYIARDIQQETGHV